MISKRTLSGHARAIVDYTPSPYDRDALRFKKDDIIDIISMNASGLWRGRSQGKVKKRIKK